MVKMTLTEKLKNKRIIFFSVQTFGLEKEIIGKLKQFGATVDYYDERPSNSTFTKGIIRLKRNIYQHRIDGYYRNILKETTAINYDILFVNRGEVIPAFFLEQFKQIHPECEMIFYTWDSFTNHTHPTTILSYFDKKFTFDSEDALKYNINFRPLFFLDGYRNIKNNSGILKYDLLFLGTAHSDRYRISSEVIKWCDDHGLKSFYYYFMHGKLVYFYKRKFDKTFKEFDYKKLSFTSLTTLEILDLYKVSNVILDINHPGQKGLTMRTFESVGAGKKMITTNAEVKKYSFYNPQNIYIIDRANMHLDRSFFESDYEDVSAEMYERMSIDGWLNCVFVENEPNIWISGMN
ncbi:hypothetical protein [Flavobacterium suzhouense]|uniref:Lipopolysaccharide biosynthesis protein n=1 Tax=Flavobacterium suzhouense TaxID=1529638 RepID=A0ABW5NQ31_9FLAO